MFKKQSVYRSFLNAARGFYGAVKSERNLRTALMFIPPVTGYCIFAEIKGARLAVVIMCIFAVIMAELANTAVEHTIDAIIKEYDERAKKAKDTAAAITLAASVCAAFCGVVVMYDGEKIMRLFEMLKNPAMICLVAAYLAAAYIIIFKTGGKNG